MSTIAEEINRLTREAGGKMMGAGNIADALSGLSIAKRNKTQGGRNIQEVLHNFHGSAAGASGKVVPGSVLFIDGDGNVTDVYTREEILKAKKMPANPEKEGFIAQGWNWSLEDIQEYMTKYPDAVMTIGQMYAAKRTDGKTRIYLNINNRLTVPLMFQQSVSGAVTLNWGDGSEEETVEGTGVVTTSHTYPETGEYVLSLEVTDPECVLDFGDGGEEGHQHNLFGESSSVDHTNAFGSYATKIELGDCITSVGSYAFRNCIKISAVSIQDGTTSIEDNAFNSCYCLCNINLPSSIAQLNTRAFMGCHSLKSIVVPEGIGFIQDRLCQNCYALIAASIPNSVTAIGSAAFSQCYGLIYTHIPNGVVSIGSNGFYYCYALTTIFIPENVASIGEYAFNGCHIACGTLYSSLMSIGSYAFSGCYYFGDSVIIPDGTTSVNRNVFTACYSIVNLEIPSSVTSIGQSAFDMCQGLSMITVHATTPPTLGSDALRYIPSDCIIYVPYGTGDTYKAASGWSTYASQIQEMAQEEN